MSDAANARTGARLPTLPLARLGIVAAAATLLMDAFGIGNAGLGLIQLGMLGAAGALIGIDVFRDLAGARTLVAARHRIVAFAPLAAQLVLLYLVILRFQIENPAFYDRIVPIAFVGFFLHHLVPPAHRLRLLVALSVAGIVAVLGLKEGAWLLGVGLGLIALCHIPVPFAARVGAILLAAAGLALSRMELLPTPWSRGVWPILASMFMFRMIVYLYDLRHSKQPAGAVRSVAYFFMLPNLVFPLFPVVDFAAFRRNHYDKPDIEIYQRGISWMALGIGQLLLYRVIYQYLSVGPDEIRSPAALGQYIVTNFLLYFRVSGQFHTAVGMLHLFGFRLPATNHFFFLATSFTDLWRRINIYWKDFMMKVAYYPTYFRARRLGDTAALVLATLVVFVFTWALHSYQWFWILGAALLSWTDVLFWSILGVCMLANSLLEARKGRVRTLAKPTWTLRSSAIRGLKTLAFFSFLSLLWSLWTAPTVRDWVLMLRGADFTVMTIVPAAALVAGVVALFVIGHRLVLGFDRLTNGSSPAVRRRWQLAVTTAATAAAIVVTLPAVSERLTPAGQSVIRDLRLTELNRQDEALLRRGYYENLAGVNRFNSQLWQVYAQRPTEWPHIWQTEAGRSVQSVLQHELVPLAGIYFRGQPLRTNQWGMRDREYDLVPAEGTYRIALFGPSYVMGDGIGDGETFEWILEDRLNAERGAGELRVEILNFAMGAYSSLQHPLALREKALRFAPVEAWLVANPDEPDLVILRLAEVIRAGVQVPYEALARRLATLQIESTLSNAEILQRLRPHANEITGDLFDQFVHDATEAGMPCTLILLSIPGRPPREGNAAAVLELARRAGFSIVDLSDVYDGYSVEELAVAPWDRHPNAIAHRLIADRLYTELSPRLAPEVIAGRTGSLPGAAESANRPH